ncbi:hypothetical protein SADUNF_Sadunf06G0043100 [Salix dunnii]|uniref:Uncharacterized protein n=1 Tax=Salix dunnii TaxID=1413687 RepID=A0A835K124_9ROSI|nr:hypothetical protein SADUNF_Sadunf06G0043100 [Salix dunnii]
MVQLDQPIKPYGFRRHRPAILSLPRAGSNRCSVKPASRCTLRSRSHDSHVFTRKPWLNSRLETDGPESSKSESNPLGRINVPPPYSSHSVHVSKLNSHQLHSSWFCFNIWFWVSRRAEMVSIGSPAKPYPRQLIKVPRIQKE